MRRYETIVIIDPDLSEEDRTSLLNRAKEIIPQQQGVFIQEDLWGVRKLAYEINKKPRGFYALLDYCGTGKAVDELERLFRIDDRAMKFITVQLAAEADPEKIKADIAAAKANAQQAASATEQAAPSIQPMETQDDDSSMEETGEGETTPER
ncbi:MAG: 30S ribosomal protein S6 [Desulfobacteraceae bacterium]|nr:30S ribosomal protein S6 [Desulfobacteraceae bacterium]